jgi:hypothetical protein
LLSTFGETERVAVSAYRRFVEDVIGHPGPWQQLSYQVFSARRPLSKGCGGSCRRTAISRRSRAPSAAGSPSRYSSTPVFEYARIHSDRDTAIAAAYVSGGYTLEEIAAFFGLH